jgi:tetratricopeptide (TPR) repeat protein
MLTTYFAILAMSLALTIPQAQEARAEAERLAKAGNHAEALKRFQEIVAANPADTAARVWIGRLHMEMGEPRRAAAVFESVVATEPQNVEALIGLGRALSAAGRRREAAEALDRAEALGADRVDILTAQGHLHAAEGRSTLALAYFARAAVLDPTNEEIRQAAEAVRAARAHRLELGYDFQHFNTASTDDTHTGTFGFNGRLSDTFRVFVVGQTHHAFDDYESRGGGGIEWFAHRRVFVRAGALFGSDTFELPELDVFGSLVGKGTRVDLGVDLRFVDYEGADLWIGGPTLTWRVTDRASAYAEYHWGRINLDSPTGATNTDTIILGFKSRLGRRASGTFEYRHGIDRLDWLTIDRLAAPDANTISLGAGFDVTPFVTIDGRYDHQSRPEDVTVQRASGRLVFRF